MSMKHKNAKKADEKIDFVVTWVDSLDTEWIEEKQIYQNSYELVGRKDNRYRDLGLLKYWFRGVEKFAPWVNKVFFITCGQRPEWLNVEHPKLVMVSHQDYIPGELLPTFNSNVIELFLHHITDLSEHFVLFNDDVFLIGMTKPEDFFIKGIPLEMAVLDMVIAQSSEDLFPHTIINNMAILNQHFDKRQVIRNNMWKFFSWKYGINLIRNILLFGFRYFSSFRDFHITSAYCKSTFEKVWEVEYERLFCACKEKFRSNNDISHWLIKNWQICEGNFKPRSYRFGKKLELGCDGNIESLIKKQKYKVLCINDSFDNADIEILKVGLDNGFHYILPEKSSYEI